MYFVQGWIPAFAGMTIKSLLGCSLLLIVVLATRPAHADVLTEAVAELGGSSFAAKEKAIAALAKLGDPRAVPVLKGLAEVILIIRRSRTHRDCSFEQFQSDMGVTGLLREEPESM